MAEWGRLVEPESSVGVDDAVVEDITDFHAVESHPRRRCPSVRATAERNRAGSCIAMTSQG
eukprot:10839749-Alexandrium_andersonii.AAC.1